MSLDKCPIFANQGTRLAIKSRLTFAERGHDLLKKRTDGLQMKFRKILAQLLEKKAMIETLMRTASFSLVETKYVISDINKLVLEGVGRARIRVISKEDTIGGVKLEIFEWFDKGVDNYQYAGLAGGRQQVLKLKENYHKVIDLVVQLASLQSSFLILDDIIKKITRRVNALRHLIIPKLECALSYVSTELDEHEREEFFRMKRVQKKKKSRIAPKTTSTQDAPVKSIFEEDEDILF